MTEPRVHWKAGLSFGEGLRAVRAAAYGTVLAEEAKRRYMEWKG